MIKLNSTTWKETTDDKFGKLEIIIGDEKQLDFKPQIKLERWNNEVNYSIRLVDDNEKKPIVRKNIDKIEWQSKNKKVYFYPLRKKLQKKKGSVNESQEFSYEMEIILKEKPISNIIHLTTSIKGLKYRKNGEGYEYYRLIPSLKEILGDKVPDKEEETVFFLNPIIIKDNEENKTKSEIELSDEFLKIVIDQDWLDKAVYPISIDPSYTVKTGAATNSLYSTALRHLARKSNGNLVCAYCRSDGTYFQIYISTSTDNGQIWTEEAVTSGTVNCYYPAIAIDSNDDIHVIWFNGSTDACMYKKKIGGSWGSEETVGAHGSYNSVAIDSNNDVHVAYSRTNYGTHYKKRTAGSWGSEETPFSGIYQREPSIAVDNNNDVYVTCNDGGGSPEYVSKLKKRTAGSWGSEETIGGTGGDNICCIAVNGSSNVYVVYVNSLRIKFKKRTAGIWGGEETLGEAYDEKNPSIAVDSNNYLHVTWMGKYAGSTTYFQIRYRKYTTSWQTIENLTSASIDQWYASLISAYHPIISGYRTNRTKNGYAFVWNDNTTIKYYASSDLEWEGEVPPPSGQFMTPNKYW